MTFDTTNKRLAAHIASLKIVEDGLNATNVSRQIAAGSRLVVVSFYIRMTAAPASQSRVFQMPGPASVPTLMMDTAGTLTAQIGTSGGQTTAGTYNDSNWHRIDMRIDTSGTTQTIDWYVNGVLQTQVSRSGLTAADMTGWRLGSTNAAENATCWYQDFVISVTTGDFPIGGHVVLPLYPVGEGTETLGTTNAIVDEAAAQANLYQHVDDWNGGTPNTTDYITYTSTTTGDAASNFAEFTIQSPASNAVIWDVAGYVAGFAAGTNVDTADTQVLTAHGGTLIDHIGNLIDYSGSTTVLGYFKQPLARPSGGWTPANLGAAVIQWGRSTDTNPQPRLSAVMLEYAAARPPGIVVDTRRVQRNSLLRR